MRRFTPWFLSDGNRCRTGIVWVGIVTVSLLATVNLEAQPDPVGEEFQVNSYDDLHMFVPAVATAPDGGFVVAWQSTQDNSVQGRRFTSDASPIGEDFLVNTFNTSYQTMASIVMSPQGEFAILWQSGTFFSPGPDGSDESVQAQLYDLDGFPTGSEFQVNTTTTYGQSQPSAATALDGTFIAVWGSAAVGGSAHPRNIQGQRLSFDGSFIGSEFQVDTSTAVKMLHPAIAVSEVSGSFLVVWEEVGATGTDDSGFSVWGRLFSADGTPVGDDFQVNTATTNYQYRPAVAAHPDGGFVVVWASEDGGTDDPDGFGVRAQQFDELGHQVASEFQVNSSTSGDQIQPAVAYSPEGKLLAVWVDGVQGLFNEGLTIEGQLFAADGRRLGSQFQVASYTTIEGTGVLYPAVATDPDGTFVVVWQDSKSAFDTDIQGRRFAYMPIFVDGFESGDTTLWSTAVP